MTYQHETRESGDLIEHDSNSRCLAESPGLWFQSISSIRGAWMCWLRGALPTALLALSLMLPMLAGHSYAQILPPGNEPAPAPAAPGPLETTPSPQEQLLAPIPQQFNWLER